MFHPEATREQRLRSLRKPKAYLKKSSVRQVKGRQIENKRCSSSMVQGLASHPKKFRLRAKSKEESRKNFKAKVRGVEVCISESDFWLRHGSIKTGAGETS